MSKIKNLFLPGTNKNAGYLYSNNTLCIYKRFIKYFPFMLPLRNDGQNASAILKGPLILTQKIKETEKNIQLYSWAGYFYNIEKKTYDFFNCTFKTPDNLDVIEMAYLYKHWNPKKKTK
jgi:hypothetical protein